MPITRRSALKLSAAALVTPAILGATDALASSGSVKVLTWPNYVGPKLVERFEAETGIDLEVITFGSNEEAASLVKASGGKGYDVVFPSMTVSGEYLDADGESLFAKVPDEVNVDALIPSFVRDSVSLGGVHNGEQILLPFNWGTECITLNRDELDIADEDISFGDLWRPEVKGKAAFRQKSVMFGTGLYLDSIGVIGSNRMLDIYLSEEDARRVFSDITKWILERKENFGAFWNNATEATSAFTEAGSVIGQTWDATGLGLNRKDSKYVYRAPKEGAITWLDSFGLLKGAENREQAIEFMNFMLKPESGGEVALLSSSNSAVAGFDKFTDDTYIRQFNEVYRPDVLSNMWWWQSQPPFVAAVLNEFVEIITNA